MEQQTLQSLNFINGKTYPYGSKVILRHYNFQSDPKLGPGIVVIRRIPYNCHASTTILYLSWDSKIKEAVNQPRYGIVYNWKYSQILGFHNNWIIINSLDGGTYEEIHEHINRTIFDGNVMNMPLIIMEGKYSAIDTDDSSCHG